MIDQPPIDRTLAGEAPEPSFSPAIEGLSPPDPMVTMAAPSTQVRTFTLGAMAAGWVVYEVKVKRQ